MAGWLFMPTATHGWPMVDLSWTMVGTGLTWLTIAGHHRTITGYDSNWLDLAGGYGWLAMAGPSWTCLVVHMLDMVG